MNWAWTTSLDQSLTSMSLSMWLTLAAAVFFGFLVLFALLRAEKSVANGALTVLTLAAIGVAVVATMRGYGPPVRDIAGQSLPPATATARQPALACLDDLAGDLVQQGCEKAVFSSAESTAAAVGHVASMISQLTALGDVTAAQRIITPEIQALRRAIERDRYGLVAQVLLARERCTPTVCPMYRSLTDNRQIITNMDERLYDGLVARYAPTWNAPSPVTTASTMPAAPNLPLNMLPPSVPTGRPTNAEFPSSANTPAVSIMTPEPGAKPSAAPGRSAAPPPVVTAPTSLAPAPPPPAKKQSAGKQRPAATPAPTPISPAASGPPKSDD